MNLYRVTLRGMHIDLEVASIHGISYVVASGPDRAYDLVRADLNKRDIGLSKDRALQTVDLLAQNVEYPECGYRLRIEKE